MCVLWAAMAGTFGTLFIGNRTAPNETGQQNGEQKDDLISFTKDEKRMKAIVGMELVNMLLWGVTSVWACAWCCVGRKKNKKDMENGGKELDDTEESESMELQTREVRVTPPPANTMQTVPNPPRSYSDEDIMARQWAMEEKVRINAPPPAFDANTNGERSFATPGQQAEKQAMAELPGSSARDDGMASMDEESIRERQAMMEEKVRDNKSEDVGAVTRRREESAGGDDEQWKSFVAGGKAKGKGLAVEEELPTYSRLNN